MRLLQARTVPCVVLLAFGGALLVSACGGSSKPKSASSSSTTQTTATTVTGSSSSTPGVVTATAGEVSATLHATTHKPKVNAAWPISFVVTKAGSPVLAHLSYEYVFAGNVVAKRSNYTFTGHFHDIFRWPSSAVGYPLTFRAVLLAAGQTLYLDYPVEVVR